MKKLVFLRTMFLLIFISDLCFPSEGQPIPELDNLKILDAILVDPAPNRTAFNGNSSGMGVGDIDDANTGCSVSPDGQLTSIVMEFTGVSVDLISIDTLDIEENVAEDITEQIDFRIYSDLDGSNLLGSESVAGSQPDTGDGVAKTVDMSNYIGVRKVQIQRVDSGTPGTDQSGYAIDNVKYKKTIDFENIGLVEGESVLQVEGVTFINANYVSPGNPRTAFNGNSTGSGLGNIDDANTGSSITASIPLGTVVMTFPKSVNDASLNLLDIDPAGSSEEEIEVRVYSDPLGNNLLGVKNAKTGDEDSVDGGAYPIFLSEFENIIRIEIQKVDGNIGVAQPGYSIDNISYVINRDFEDNCFEAELELMDDEDIPLPFWVLALMGATFLWLGQREQKE